MIFQTSKDATKIYIWNTAHALTIEKDVLLTNYTDLEEDTDEATLTQTYVRVCREYGVSMEEPQLLMVIGGDYSGCIVWVDGRSLIEWIGLKDPNKGIEFYAED